MLLPLFIFSQKRDTTFSKVGDFEFMEIKEVHKFKGPSSPRFKTAKEEREFYLEKQFSTFHVEKRLSAMDSVIYFYENEKIEKIIFRGTRYIYNYDKDWNFEYVEREYKSEKTYLFWENLSFEVYQWQPQIVGKSGEEIPFQFKIKNRINDTLNLQLSTNDQSIRLFSSDLKMFPQEEQDIILRIQIDYVEGKKYLIFSNDKNQTFKFPIEVIGYDLDDDDFLSSYFYEKQLPIDIGTRENIVIKLDDGERLLRIYKEGNLVWNHPIGRIVNKVNIAYLETGEYLFEIVDLKNNEKRYCRITKEGAN